MKDMTLEMFEKRWEEVMELSPQTLGPFTPAYKMIVKRLKVMPWPAFVLAGTVTVGFLYLVLGSAITLVVNVLQRGF